MTQNSSRSVACLVICEAGQPVNPSFTSLFWRWGQNYGWATQVAHSVDDLILDSTVYYTDELRKHN